MTRTTEARLLVVDDDPTGSHPLHPVRRGPRAAAPAAPSPATGPGGMVSAAQRRWRRTPLRTTLVGSLLLLVMLALVASGLLATALLRGHLVDRVDDRLRSSAVALAEGGARSRVVARGEGLPSTHVVAITDATGAIVAGPTSTLSDPAQPLPVLDRVTGGDPDPRGELTTVRAERGDAAWRLLATPLGNGDEGALLVAEGLGDVDDTVTRLLALLAVVGVVVAVLIGALGRRLVRVHLRPLDEVTHAAALIAAGDLGRRLPDRDPRTEVGSLSASLNTVLGQVEGACAERRASEAAAVASEAAVAASEARMRRFVADASHELRTPLTSIRGFAELFRHGGIDDPETRARMMRRIEDEATRMDQQRPLEQGPVDLLVIATDAVHDARASTPERRIALDVTGTVPPPVVTGDDARLRQVVGNLVSNALGHTPTGTSVTVRVRTSARASAHEAVLEVVDDGPGMTAEQAERAFERFYRVDESRHRSDGAAGGSGLGLAIVSALVAGHGGIVELDTGPGQGCAVRVRLPVRGG